MKILIVNTSELSGGAALAASRLKDALNKQGEKAMMLVRDKQSDDPTVVGIGGGLGSSLRFLWERVRILLSLRFNRSHLFDLDTGYCGFDITRLKEFRDADVVHLHWVNQGMLSLSGLRRILESAASRWCGPCTMPGLQPPSATLLWDAIAISRDANGANTCPEAVRQTTCRQQYGNASRASSRGKASLS